VIIHPTAIVEDGAQLGEDATVVPGCVPGAEVSLAADSSRGFYARRGG